MFLDENSRNITFEYGIPTFLPIRLPYLWQNALGGNDFLKLTGYMG